MKHKSVILLVFTATILAFSCTQILFTPVAAQSGRKTTSDSSDKKKKDMESPDTTKPATTTQSQDPNTTSSGPAGGLSGKPPLKKKADQPEKGSDQDTLDLGTNIVNVSVVVYDKKSGKIYQGLKKDNFKIFEDGVEQKLTNFSPSDAPITNVVVL